MIKIKILRGSTKDDLMAYDPIKVIHLPIYSEYTWRSYTIALNSKKLNEPRKEIFISTYSNYHKVFNCSYSNLNIVYPILSKMKRLLS